MTRARPLVLLALAAVVALALSACGSSEEEATPSTNVNQLLRQTFSGSKKIESGRFALDLRIAAQERGADAFGGPVTIKVAGPFQSEGDGRLPKFALDAELNGGGQRITAGATSTGDKGYVSFQGEDYVLAGPLFMQFKAGYEEAQKRGRDSSKRSFAALGLDPRRWLKDARNAGESKVGDTETIKITGTVDVPALLDDVEVALRKAKSLGLEGAAKLPDGLTAQQRRQVEQAVKDLDVEIHTGKADKILRRIKLGLRIQDKQEGASGTLAFDLRLTDVNEDQDIPEPSDAKPFTDLVGRLQTLGLAFGGGAPSSGSGSGGGGADLRRYSRCVTKAGSDAAAARKCADLLTP
jgi:hypothetical protein